MLDFEIVTKIYDLIEDQDITQTALAKRLEIPISTLNGYMRERNKIPLDVIRKIAVELNVTTDYLFDLAKSPERPLSLNNTERKLIENFRSLSKSQKELILQNIIFMQNQNRTS